MKGQIFVSGYMILRLFTDKMYLLVCDLHLVCFTCITKTEAYIQTYIHSNIHSMDPI